MGKLPVAAPPLGSFLRAALVASVVIIAMLAIVFLFSGLEHRDGSRAAREGLWLMLLATGIIWATALVLYAVDRSRRRLGALAARLMRPASRLGKPEMWDNGLDGPCPCP